MNRPRRQRSTARRASSVNPAVSADALPQEVVSTPAASSRRAQRSRKAIVPPIAYFLLGCFFVLEYSRIPSIVTVLGMIRIQMLVLIALVICWFKFANRDDLKHPIVKWVGAFALLCALSIFYTPNTRAAFNMTLNILTYLIAGILPLLAFVRTTDRLKWFLELFVGANTFIAVWSLTHGGTGPGGFITDENDCALVLNIALPLAVAVANWPGQTRGKKWLFLGFAVVITFGSIATMSRGGFLGLVAAAACGFYVSQRKMRILLLSAGAALVLVPLAPMLLPAKYIDEVKSISDQQDGTRQNRIYFWKLGWMMYKANPILGVGAGNYPWTVADYERQLPAEQRFRNRFSGGRPSHSLYFTLLPELGTVGVIIFGAVVIQVLRSRPPKRRGRKRETAPPLSIEQQRCDLVGRAIVCSCMAFLASGAFISVLYYPSIWHLAGIAAALTTIRKQVEAKASEAPAVVS
jgi:O-antigen ligase